MGFEFGDVRLNKRCEALLNKLQVPKAHLTTTFHSWKETMAAYRFVNNDKVSPEKILRPHMDETLSRIKGKGRVLLVQDTTDMMYSPQNKISGMGVISTEEQQGFLFHMVMAISCDRVNLGLTHFKYWNRYELGKRAFKDKIAKEDKESIRWSETLKHSEKLQSKSPSTDFIVIGDRESDIWDVLVYSGPVKWLIRAAQNRKLSGESLKLFDHVKAQEVSGKISFTTDKGLAVEQDVRWAAVNISSPGGKRVLPAKATIVHCYQTNAQEGAKPIEWFLLSSVGMKEGITPLTLVEWYLARWEIEVFFKILKSGCHAEKIELKTFDRIIRLVSLYLIVAWRIAFLTKVSRAHPDISCSSFLTEGEWKVLYVYLTERKPPVKPPTLKEAVVMIARLGGFLARKSDGDPGPVTTWRGLMKLHDLMNGLACANLLNTCV